MAQYSEETRAKLTRLWNQNITCSQIAAQCGMTKHAVVGLIHRMGLPSRPSPIRRNDDPGNPKPKIIRETPKVSAISSDNMPAPVVAPIAKVFGRLHTCTWPLGDPRTPEFRLCGDKAIIGRSYCDLHLHVSRHGWINVAGEHCPESIWNDARDARLLDMARRGLEMWRAMAGLNELPGRRIETIDQVKSRLMRLKDKKDKAA